MKIYVVGTGKRIEPIREGLESCGEVIILGNSEKAVDNYKKLFEDDSPKILALHDPGSFDWKLPTKMLKQIKNLKGITTLSAWYMYIDIDYCKKNGIAVTHTPAANSQSVAEYAIWQMLSLARKLPQQIREGFKNVLDEEHLQAEVTGKTMGIVGLGNIGSRIAKMGAGLGMNVIYWSRSKKDVLYKRVRLDTVLSKSDYVFNCLETCDETMGFLGKERLKLMQPMACFISVLGGGGWGVEDDDYLVKMVKQGKLAGFSVENEHKHGYKFPDVGNANVFVAASGAWYTKEAKDRMNQMFVDGVKGIVTGKSVNRVV